MLQIRNCPIRIRSIALLLCFWPTLSTASESLATKAPPDALAYLSIDVGRARAEFDRLDLVRLVREEEVRDFLKPAWAGLRAASGSVQGACTMLAMYGLPDIIAGKIEIVLFGVGHRRRDGVIRWFDAAGPPDPETLGLAEDPGEWLPDLAVAIETTGRTAFSAAFERLLELPLLEIRHEPARRAGFDLVITTIAGDHPSGAHESFCHTYVGDQFVAALRPERLVQVLRGPADARGQRLAGDEAFSLWRASSVRGTEVLELFVPVERLVRFAGPCLDPALRNTLAATGLGALPGAALALSLEAGRIRDSLAVVLPDEDTPLVRPLRALGPCGTAAGDIPADAAAALAVRVELHDFLKAARAAGGAISPDLPPHLDALLSAFSRSPGLEATSQQNARLDLDATLYARLRRPGLIPNLAGSLAPADAARIRAALEKAQITAAREGSTFPEIHDLRIEGTDIAGYVPQLSDSLLPLSLAFCVKNGVLTVASSPAALRHVLAGSSATLCRDSPDFGRAVATTVGQDFDHVVALLYLDVARVSDHYLRALELVLPALLPLLPVDLDATLLPLPETVASHLSGMLVCLRVSERVAAIDSSGPLGGWVLAAPALAALLQGTDPRFAGPLEHFLPAFR